MVENRSDRGIIGDLDKEEEITVTIVESSFQVCKTNSTLYKTGVRVEEEWYKMRGQYYYGNFLFKLL